MTRRGTPSTPRFATCSLRSTTTPVLRGPEQNTVPVARPRKAEPCSGPQALHFYGYFLTSVVQMPLVKPQSGGPTLVPVIKTEEKGSDVNLACHLVADAFEKKCTAAFVISNDSDLLEPIRLSRHSPRQPRHVCGPPLPAHLLPRGLRHALMILANDANPRGELHSAEEARDDRGPCNAIPATGTARERPHQRSRFSASDSARHARQVSVPTNAHRQTGHFLEACDLVGPAVSREAERCNFSPCP